MDYSSSAGTPKVAYGTWKNGSAFGGDWEFVTPTVSSNSTSWAKGSISKTSEPWLLTISCNENSSTTRSGYFYVNFADGTRTKISLSLTGIPDPTYTFRLDGTLSKHSARKSTSSSDGYCSTGAKLYSYKTDHKGNITKVGASLYTTYSEVYKCWTSGSNSLYYDFAVSLNENTTGSTKTVKFKILLDESNKTVDVSVPQGCWVFNLGDTMNGATSGTWEPTSAASTKNIWLACLDNAYSSSSGKWPTFTVSTASTGWITISPTSGSNGTLIAITAAKNTTTSARTGTVTFTLAVSGNKLTVTVKLAAGTTTPVLYGLYIKNGYTSERRFIVSTVSLNGITSALASQCLLTPVPANSKSVLINTATSSKSSPSSTTTIFSSGTLSRSLYIYYLDSNGNIVLASSGSKTNGSTVNC